MKKRKGFILEIIKTACVLTACSVSFTKMQAQETTQAKPLLPSVRVADNVQLKIGGFIRTEYLFDSRQHLAAVNDLVGFFPVNKQPAENGKDLTDVARSSISSKGTRVNLGLTGPDVLNAKSNAFFEIDFTGNNEPAVNIRFRHAWIKMSWEKAELLLGKTWNPLGETPAPGVAGLAGAAPYRPFGRSDQIRLVLKPDKNFHVWLAGVYKTEHVFNPDGADIKNSTLPELHLQLRYVSPNFSAGLVSAYKNIRPALSATADGKTYIAENTVSSYALGGFVDFKAGQFNGKAGVTFGQNLGEYFMVGGYAVKEVDSNGIPSYTPLMNSSYWAFLSYAGKHWTPGLFFGYTQNNGFKDELKEGGRPIACGPVGGTAFGLANAYRIAPSLKYSVGRLAFHAELEYNAAAYGTEFDNKRKATKSETVGGIRFLLATSFFF
jgi:hypothetical protein